MKIFDRPSLVNRPDTFLGVCQGLSEDLGIPPILLRLALAGLLFWNPLAALCTYLVAGLLVLATRLLAPVPASASAGEREAEPAIEASPVQERKQLPLAA